MLAPRSGAASLSQRAMAAFQRAWKSDALAGGSELRDRAAAVAYAYSHQLDR